MRRNPDLRFAAAHPAHLVALGFGIGLVPFAPGTFGTLLGWPIGHLLATGYSGAALLAIVALFFLIGTWACGITGRHLGAHDHGAMVWDEIVAFVLVLVFVPATLAWQAAAFVAFRAFDIVKPPPIGWIERRFHGGFGAMFDDLVAAGYALLCLAVAKRVLG